MECDHTNFSEFYIFFFAFRLYVEAKQHICHITNVHRTSTIKKGRKKSRELVKIFSNNGPFEKLYENVPFLGLYGYFAQHNYIKEHSNMKLFRKRYISKIFYRIIRL